MIHLDNATLFRIDLASYEKTGKKLKCTILSERSQSEKATDYMILTI